MNSKRSTNRKASASRAMKDGDSNMHYSSGEDHASMRGRMIPSREPGHHEDGGNYTHEAYASHGSPASKGASKGPGPLPGAGQMPPVGPGPATKGFAQREATESPISPTPTGAAPKGMKTYNQE